MSWLPIALVTPQYVDANGDAYSGAVLKAYQSGTSTNTSLATDNTGGTTATSITLNAAGYPEVSGSVVIPHIDRDYKISLYPTQAAADADTGAIWTVDSMVLGGVFTAAGTGATARTIVAKLADIQSLKDYGATGDGSTGDSVAIQAAIDAVSAAGGGFLWAPEGTYVIDAQITLKSKVIIAGDGMHSTIFQAQANLDADMFRSLNYSTLTGQNKWLTSAGVQYALGFQDCCIDGNKANQSSGNGVVLYAKGILMDHVLIRDVYGIGLMTETGDVGGQTDETDLPEGGMDHVWIRNSGSHGWQMRGPHDLHVAGLQINESGGKGVVFERVASTYNGSCDVLSAHVYANTDIGVHLNACTVRFGLLISESNYKEGLVLASADQTQFSNLQLYRNCRSSGTFQMTIDSSTQGVVCGPCLIRTPELATVGGVQISGDYIEMPIMYHFGFLPDGTTPSGGTAVEVVAGANQVNLGGSIYSFGGTNGVGLSTNTGGACASGMFNFRIVDCKTLWVNGSGGTKNTYNITGTTVAGQTPFTGTAPNVNNELEQWNAMFTDESAVHYKSKSRIRHTSAVDLNSTALQTFTIPHNLIAAPTLNDVSISLEYTGANTTWVLAQFFVFSVDATNVVVKAKLSTAAGGATSGYVLLNVQL